MRAPLAAAALALLLATPAVQAAPLAPVVDGSILSKESTVEAATNHDKKRKHSAKRKPSHAAKPHTQSRNRQHRA